MATESYGYIKILPDSTGKRIANSVMAAVLFTGATSPNYFNIGDVITSQTSGNIGTVIKIDGGPNHGEVYISLTDPVQNNPTYILGENLLVNGQTIAIANSTGFPYYIQQTNISGGRTPTNLMEVDVHGSAYMRFKEGSPQFDAFGKLQVSNQSVIAEYLSQYGLDTDRMSVQLDNSAGTVTHLPLSAGILLTNDTSNGCNSEIVSNYYHPYALGQSRLVEFTCACGDTGKAGLLRVWGYGDDYDGVFFQQKDGIFGVMVRSSVSGAIVESFIHQAEWNTDRLDGSKGVFNPSDTILDVTKDTIYWIDLQWLGAGTIRFGTIMNGLRIIGHQWDNTNVASVPYMRTATLPVYFEQHNNTTTASGSEFRIWCATVKNEGTFSPATKDFGEFLGDYNVTSTTPALLCAFRAAPFFGGQINRKSIYIDTTEACAIGGNIVFELWKNPIYSGGTWVNPDADRSATEISKDGSFDLTGARKLATWIIAGSGERATIAMDEVFNSNCEGIRRWFDSGAGYDVYVGTLRLTSGTAPSVVSIAMNWDEV